jgi:hypothetical protein
MNTVLTYDSKPDTPFSQICNKFQKVKNKQVRNLKWTAKYIHPIADHPNNSLLLVEIISTPIVCELHTVKYLAAVA